MSVQTISLKNARSGDLDVWGDDTFKKVSYSVSVDCSSATAEALSATVEVFSTTMAVFVSFNLKMMNFVCLFNLRFWNDNAHSGSTVTPERDWL
jgi:hypothetical protein